MRDAVIPAYVSCRSGINRDAEVTALLYSAAEPRIDAALVTRARRGRRAAQPVR
mgnify:CR=1 FL=1